VGISEGPSVSISSVPPHRAFFEALGALPDGSPEWRAALAGLVTLRYLDAWSDSGAVTDDLATERRAVENAINVLPANAPERIYLGGLVDASTTDRAKDLTRVVSLLLAYGRALQHRGSWALAADVFLCAYRACAQVAQQPVQCELATSALLRAAQCHCELGDTGAATRIHQVALSVGMAAGDAYALERTRAAIAKLTEEYGVAPAASGAAPAAVVSDRPVDLPRAVEATALPDAATARAASSTAEPLTDHGRA